jgi:hypothetical protein
MQHTPHHQLPSQQRSLAQRDRRFNCRLKLAADAMPGMRWVFDAVPVETWLIALVVAPAPIAIELAKPERSQRRRHDCDRPGGERDRSQWGRATPQATFRRNRSLYVLAEAVSCSCKLHTSLEGRREKSRFHKGEPRNEHRRPLILKKKFYRALAFLP